MILDYSLSDTSAALARKILNRGTYNLQTILDKVCGSAEFTYVACPDFSISLRQRRLILGLPIGGYVKWRADYRFFPLELDVNSCGVHMLKLPGDFDIEKFESNLFQLKHDLDEQKLVLNNVLLKWNFSRRNHFINIYEANSGNLFLVAHSSGETTLFDWDGLHKMFAVKHIDVNGRSLPYIQGNDVEQYYKITERENKFFFDRHTFIFDRLLGEGNYEVTYADQHFGMISQGEILMGCSKLKPNTVFPLLTRPFSELLLAKATNPPHEIITLTDGYALVPHGLGMSLPKDVIDITPCEKADGYVYVNFANGSMMLTDTLEYVGVTYRPIDVIPEMGQRIGFEIIDKLKPLLFTKV